MATNQGRDYGKIRTEHMDLRDYYAGMALQALLTRPLEEITKLETEQGVARVAVAFAEALLDELAR